MVAGAIKQDKELFFFLLLSLSVVVAGVSLLFLSTPWGVGIFPDSTSYIAAARSLLRGEGLMAVPEWGRNVPYTQYAPHISILLAGIGILGVDPLIGAKGLHLFLFGTNIFLPGWVIFHATCS